jgi:glycosyltransferase involved in cell wall biosynthesis
VSRDVVAIGPATGGVAHVFGHLTDQLERSGWDVTARQLGTAVNPHLEALRALRALWSQLRAARVVHVELGSNDLAAFWFLFWVSLVRRDVVAIAHDVPLRLVKSPGSGLVGGHTRWRLRLGHRVLSPVLDRAVEAVVRRRVGRWGVLSDAAREHWAPRVRGTVAVVPHGAEPATPGALAPSAGEYVLFAGYLSPSKGVDVLVDAWTAVASPSDLPLVVAGPAAGAINEPYVADLQRRGATAPNPPRWIGEPDDDAFAELFTRAALVVLPYRSSSAASGILVRAMVEGRCILAADIPAFRTGLEPGVDAVLVPAGDGQALATELRALLADPARRDALGRAAGERGARSFTYQAQADAVIAIYEGR